MAEGEPAEKEVAAVPAKAAEPASWGTTVQRAFVVVVAIGTVLESIAVFTATRGESGWALFEKTAIVLLAIMIFAIVLARFIQNWSKKVTATAGKLLIAAILVIAVSAGYGLRLTRTNSTTKNPPPTPAASPSVPVAPTSVVATSAETTAAPTSAVAQAPSAGCTGGAGAVPVVPAGGTEFDIQIDVCTPASAGQHYWLTVVLHNQGSGKTTNYYPLGDVATLPTTPDASGRLVPYFSSTIPEVSSTRCWQVLMTPDSMQQDLVNQNETGQYLYTNGSRPPAGVTFASPCVAEPE
ncbi:MAG TPA: hypothetical protein VGX23_32430 [Actinocrinis sp.]|nr:hypothetical protein [Actinocrinis sp.]